MDDLWRPPASEVEPWRWPRGVGSRVLDFLVFSAMSLLAVIAA